MHLSLHHSFSDDQSSGPHGSWDTLGSRTCSDCKARAGNGRREHRPTLCIAVWGSPSGLTLYLPPTVQLLWQGCKAHTVFMIASQSNNGHPHGALIIRPPSLALRFSGKVSGNILVAAQQPSQLLTPLAAAALAAHAQRLPLAWVLAHSLTASLTLPGATQPGATFKMGS